MGVEDIAAASKRVLQKLDELDDMRSEKRTASGVVPKAPATSREVREKLAEAWALIDDAASSVRDWRKRTTLDVGLGAVEARLRHALGFVDDAIKELEPSASARKRALALKKTGG